MTWFTAELDDHIYLQRVRKHLASGNESSARSTPASFLDRREFQLRLLAIHDELTNPLPALPLSLERPHHGS